MRVKPADAEGPGALTSDHVQLTYVDLIAFNWTIPGPGACSPKKFLLGKPGLLVSTFPDNVPVEQRFNTAQSKMLAAGASLPKLCVKAPASIRDGNVSEQNDEQLLKALTGIGSVVHAVMLAFHEIQPVPGSDTYVAQVPFAKLMANFANPSWRKLRDDATMVTKGPAGQASPIFHLLDFFFNRKSFGSELGGYVDNYVESYPAYWRDFLVTMQQPPHVDEYLLATPDRPLNARLRGAYAQAFQAYAGEHSSSLLGRHLLKLYGYLDVMFKVGRDATVGGAAGGILDGMSDRLYGSIEASRRDRFKSRCPTLMRSVAKIVNIERIVNSNSGVDDWLKVELDVGNSGVRFGPGYHVRILPMNAASIVDKTLAMLGGHTGDVEPDVLASIGNEVVTIDALEAWDPRWPEVLLLHIGPKFPKQTSVTVRQLLLYGDVYPLWQSSSDRLAQENGGGFSRIKEAGVQPLDWRTYSISSPPAVGHQKILTITVRLWPVADGILPGAFTNFLDEYCQQLRNQQHDPNCPLSSLVIQVHPSPTIRVPELGGLAQLPPLVMFAAGTGLSPFKGILKDTASNRPRIIVFVTRVLSQHQRDDLHDSIFNEGNLNASVVVIVTRKCAGREINEEHKTRPGAIENESRWFIVHDASQAANRQYVASFADSKTGIVKKIALHMRAPGAKTFACGNAGFCIGLYTTLKHDWFQSDDGWFDSAVAKGIVVFEMFTTKPAADSPDSLPISLVTVVRSVTSLPEPVPPPPEPLIIINKLVYRVQGMLPIHPGGTDVLKLYWGGDATRPFNTIGHDRSSEVMAMLSQFYVGKLEPSTHKTGPMYELEQAWREQLLNAVELRNALELDASYLADDLNAPVEGQGDSELQQRHTIKVCNRFLQQHLPNLERLVRPQTPRHPSANLVDRLYKCVVSSLPDAGLSTRLRLEGIQNSSVWMIVRPLLMEQVEQSDGLPELEQRYKANGPAMLKRFREFEQKAVTYLARGLEGVCDGDLGAAAESLVEIYRAMTELPHDTHFTLLQPVN